jgi:hypothetical protein
MCVKFSKMVVGAGTGSFQVNGAIPLFDRQHHPLRPDLPSGGALGAAAVNDAAGRGGTGEAGAKRP